MTTNNNDTRQLIADIDRGSSGGRNPVRLGRALLEELLSVDDNGQPRHKLDGDDLRDQPQRRNFQAKLDKIIHDEEGRAATEQMTTREIVDSIPRHGF